MSPVSRSVAAPTTVSTNPRNTLRLLTLAAVVVAIFFKQFGAEDTLEQPVLAHAEQISSTETE